MRNKNVASKLGKLIFYLSLFLAWGVFASLMFTNGLRETLITGLGGTLPYSLCLIVFGLTMIAGIFSGFYLWINTLPSIQVRVIVISRNKAQSGLLATIAFETVENEIITLNTNKDRLNAPSKNDVGTLHYKLIKDKFIKLILKRYIDDQGRYYAKFESEGKSANPSCEEVDEQCRNCGSVIGFDKFCTQTTCRYCIGSKTPGTSSRNEAIETAKKLERALSIHQIKRKIGHVIVLLFGFAFVICTIVIIGLLLRGVGAFFGSVYFWFFAAGSLVALTLFLAGSHIWHNALPVLKVRAIVESRGEYGTLFGTVAFRTQIGESQIFDKVMIDIYHAISIGDVGLLQYKLTDHNTTSFVSFKNEGKSATFNSKIESHSCVNCGAFILMEKYKFNTQIKCEYCGSIVTEQG